MSNEACSFWKLASVCDLFKDRYKVRKHAAHLDSVFWLSYHQSVTTQIGLTGTQETCIGKGGLYRSEQEYIDYVITSEWCEA